VTESSASRGFNLKLGIVVISSLEFIHQESFSFALLPQVLKPSMHGLNFMRTYTHQAAELNDGNSSHLMEEEQKVFKGKFFVYADVCYMGKR